ncbi:MAG: hypothetical protein ACI8ZB_003766 [Desulforhopalus sp.]
MKKILLVLFVSVAVSGCSSHAGPFVTSISSDGRGGLIVEKCMAKFDPWMSTVNNDQCRTSKIIVGN